MATSPRWRRRNLFLFCDFFWIGHHHRRWHNANLRVILTIFVIVAAPCAQAQTPAPPKVTKADAQKVLKIISSDKAKTRMNWEKNWVPNIPRWSRDFRTSIRNLKSVMKSVRPWTPSIICVGGNAPARCPLLAQSGHANTVIQCLLLGGKRTWPGHDGMSANDPKRTFSSFRRFTFCQSVPARERGGCLRNP